MGSKFDFAIGQSKLLWPTIILGIPILFSPSIGQRGKSLDDYTNKVTEYRYNIINIIVSRDKNLQLFHDNTVQRKEYKDFTIG